MHFMNTGKELRLASWNLLLWIKYDLRQPALGECHTHCIRCVLFTWALPLVTMSQPGNLMIPLEWFFFFNITLPRGGGFGAGLVSKRKSWGFYCIFAFASCLLVMLCFYCFLTVFVTALSHHIITLWLRSQLLNQLFVRKVSGMNQECM